MGNIKEINIKNRTYNFFDDMINIENFNPDLLKTDQKSYKNISIYYIGYITMKNSDYVKIDSVNLLYLIIGEADGSTEGKSGNKYLTFADTDKNKKVLEKYLKLWKEIGSLIEKINDKPGKYEKDYTKIKFNSDYNLPINKMLKLHNLTIIVRSVFEKDDKYYPQISLDECLYEL